MKITKWISYKDSDNYKKANCGGLGGFFQDEMRWQDYIKCFYDKDKPHIEAIRKDVLKHQIKLTGAEHQTYYEGVPLFEDGSCATYSYRAWGDLMAAIWSEEENKDYCYLDFYM